MPHPSYHARVELAAVDAKVTALVADLAAFKDAVTDSIRAMLPPPPFDVDTAQIDAARSSVYRLTSELNLAVDRYIRATDNRDGDAADKARSLLRAAIGNGTVLAALLS